MCGNYNGNMKDDFETRSKYVASSELEFVNSWKENPLCGDATFAVDPCSLNTFRRSWAERKCSIINSQTFAACHNQVSRPHNARPPECPAGMPQGYSVGERPQSTLGAHVEPLLLTKQSGEGHSRTETQQLPWG